MRRSFRRELLVTEVPPKPPNKMRKKRDPKNPSKTCKQLRALYAGYIDRMDPPHKHHVFADFIGVRENTASRWMYGYPPSEYNIWPIARYFARRLGVQDKVIYNEIVKALEDWRSK